MSALQTENAVLPVALGDPPRDGADDVATRDLDQLVDHIVSQHHRYIREMAPVITGWLDKLATKHGGRHPELVDVRTTFGDLRDELFTHLMKEENILFPFIADLAAARRAGTRLPAGFVGAIAHPIDVMESDHQLAGDLLARLRTLTNRYQPPADACTTYRLCYAELEHFERDLHRHIHLENNVLFPRALA